MTDKNRQTHRNRQTDAERDNKLEEGTGKIKGEKAKETEVRDRKDKYKYINRKRGRQTEITVDKQRDTQRERQTDKERN